MRRGFVRVFCTGLVMFLATGSGGSQTGPDQATIARQFAGDTEQRQHALDLACAIPRDKVGPELRSALITLLERENKLVASVTARGAILADFEDPEFIARLSRTVAELKDPQAIPALSEAIYGGFPVQHALSEFGEAAVPALLRVTRNPENHYDTVNHGLRALRLLVEGARRRQLSADSLEAIRRMAAGRLAGRQYFTTLWYAIDLAMVLGDPTLSAVVAALGNDRQAVVARGVTDPVLIEKTQRRALDRLAGIWPESRD
jgi:hypothetical protein